MAELEKIKQARQSSMNLNLQTKMTTPLKDTLKQRNATIDSTKLSALNSLEEKIKTSRYTFYFKLFYFILFQALRLGTYFTEKILLKNQLRCSN